MKRGQVVQDGIYLNLGGVNNERVYVENGVVIWADDYFYYEMGRATRTNLDKVIRDANRNWKENEAYLKAEGYR